MSVEVKIPKKLIEVALPLDAINLASVREKSIRQGHPSTFHLWWARRPLAAARAVIFAQMVNDPGYERDIGRGVNKEKAAAERARLFGIIEELVKWENTNNERVLNSAREEIWKSWKETCDLNKGVTDTKIFDPNILPEFYDPFAGGGTIPLEAQRLGLEVTTSDLNPVAVVINKALMEATSRFQNSTPIGPVKSGSTIPSSLEWLNAKGLAEDVRRYAVWMRDEVEKKLEHFYPQFEIKKETAEARPDLKGLVGQKFSIMAWLWARTVKSPNPAVSNIDVPLCSTFVLCAKPGQESYVEPVVDKTGYRFEVRVGTPPSKAEHGTKAEGRGSNFKCLMSGTTIGGDYIKSEGQAGRMSNKLMAIVLEGPKGRIYLSPTDDQQSLADSATPNWKPSGFLPEKLTGGTCVPYGLREWGDLFTKRQLLALSTFSDHVTIAYKKVLADAIEAGLPDDQKTIEMGGAGAMAYAEAIATCLALNVSRQANRSATLNFWDNQGQNIQQVFARQALPMTWDFVESNPFCNSSGNFLGQVDYFVKVLEFSAPAAPHAHVFQADATTQEYSKNKIISTDPPYYDNIAYADLSDYFYVWLRRALLPIYPTLFESKETPKMQELVAAKYRHGGKEAAEHFFLGGMRKAITALAKSSHVAFPVTIYYAFKQSDTTDDEGTTNTGWDTFLQAVMDAGFSISGTWPLRTELTGNLKKKTNALASSIVLVCRKRSNEATTISRREFIRELNISLPDALSEMITGGAYAPVAPVDLSQAIIGPGMAIFSKYTAVLEADGTAMSVKTAIKLINRFLAQDDFDHDTQFCLSWFETRGWEIGKFGEADVLARAKGTSVEGLRDGGVVYSASGNLRLVRPEEYNEDWTPDVESRVSIWEILHQMIRSLTQNGETGAGQILSKCSQYSEQIRTLAYRLYTLCERKGWAQDAGQYNALVVAWDAIEAAARSVGYSGTQISLFGEIEPSENQKNSKKKSTRKSK